MNTFIVEAENYKTLQTENVNISEYGITPDSVYSIKFEKGQDDTLMPQYQVRYPTHEEIADELWNWLEEYGCLEPYQKVQQYYEDYQAMYPAYNQGELYCYPGKVAYLSYYGDEIVIIQNNMEYPFYRLLGNQDCVLQFIQKRSYHRNLKIYIAMQATNMAIIH